MTIDEIIINLFLIILTLHLLLIAGFYVYVFFPGQNLARTILVLKGQK